MVFWSVCEPDCPPARTVVFPSPLHAPLTLFCSSSQFVFWSGPFSSPSARRAPPPLFFSFHRAVTSPTTVQPFTTVFFDCRTRRRSSAKRVSFLLYQWASPFSSDPPSFPGRNLFFFFFFFFSHEVRDFPFSFWFFPRLPLFLRRRACVGQRLFPVHRSIFRRRHPT